MAERLDPLQVPYSFFEGVDGSMLDLDTLPSYDRLRRRLFFGRDLKKGEMGCLLSHRAVYQHMVDHDIDTAVVLEDDVFPAPEFPDVIRSLVKHPLQWDVVRFLEGEKVYNKSRVIGPLCGKYRLTRPLVASGGAYGYMLTKKAASRFLRHMQKNAVPVDTVHSYVWRTGLETFAVNPSPVRPDREIDSTIGEDRFDKTLQIADWQKTIYRLTRSWLKLSELIGKRRAYWLSWPRDLLLKRRCRDEREIVLKGLVCGGRGMGSNTITNNAAQIKRILGADPFPGTLNIVLEKPVILRGGAQLDQKGKQFLVPLKINNTPCLVHHWSGRPLHIAEIISASPLRKTLALQDGQAIELVLRAKHAAQPALWRRLLWALFYKGRLNAYYDDAFIDRIKPLRFFYKMICQKKLYTSSFGIRPLSELLAAFPKFIAAGVAAAPVKDWLEKHASPDHIILSNTLAGPHVRPYRNDQQVRYNNADIIMLDGAATQIFYHYRYYSHAKFVLLPLDLNILRLKCIIGWLRYVTRRKLKLSGIYRAGDKYWLALKVTKIKTPVARVYAPDAWGVPGLISRLNETGQPYAVLRWWEKLENWQEGEDLDILTTDAGNNAIRNMLEGHFGTIPIDLYSVSGVTVPGIDSMAYYPPALSERILSRTEKGPLNCRIPCPEDAFFSLAYHALYHKGLDCGLPTQTGLQANPSPKHDFKAVLEERARQLNIPAENIRSMETLDHLLSEKKWQPPKDMLSRYSHNNAWVKKHFFGGDRKLPPGLCVFVVREIAEKWQAVDAIQQELLNAGFCLLEKYRIPEEERAAVGHQLRGGNWGPGHWPVAGGLPAYALVMADPSPSPVRGKKKKAMPNVDNERIFSKNTVRDKLNAQRPGPERAHFVHTSDNTAEALEYMHIIFTDAHRDMLYGKFEELCVKKRGLAA